MSHHLSIAATIALNTWFTDENLEKGFALLEQADGLIFRNSAGICFPGQTETTAALNFVPHDRTRQGFALKNAHCSQCGSGRGSKSYCHHLAAAALFALPQSAQKENRLFPLPLLLKKSAWYSLAGYLSSRTDSGNKPQLTTTKKILKLANDRIKVTLPLDHLHQLLSLFSRQLCPARGKKLPLPADPDPVRTLSKTMVKMTASANERQLNELGQQSRGQRQHNSLWFWLLTKLGGLLPESAIKFRQKKKSFFIQASGKNADFRLKLDPEFSGRLLQDLCGRLETFIMLKPAQEFTRITANSDGSLLITPCLRLADGRIFSQEELAPYRFDNIFLLEKEGFLPLVRQPEQKTVRPPRSKQLSLFDLSKPAEKSGKPFTVPNSEVIDLLQKNKTAFSCRDNEIDVNLLDLKLRDLPDSLEFCAASEDDDWCYISAHYGVGNLKISLADLLAAREQGLDYLPGSGLKLSGTSLDWFYNLGQERIQRTTDGEADIIKLNRWELLRLTSQIDKIFLPEKENSLAHIRKLLAPGSWNDSRQLPDFPDHLRQYQINGLAWLYSLYNFRLGGILADDMGLGKTHQALALLLLVSRRNPAARFLVVCPASVAPHWLMKTREFYPQLPCGLFHGAKRRLSDEPGLTITTYGLLDRDEALGRQFFDIIIFDEIQHLKNRKTLAHQAAGELDGRIKIGLTGTPLENSLYDLKNIFDVCLPGILGSDPDFKKRYMQESDTAKNRKQLAELSRRISPFMLRRNRQDVLGELPEIIDDLQTCELSDDQVRLYRQAVRDQGDILLKQLDDDGNDIPYMEILALIALLKQICDHPALIDHEKEVNDYQSGKWDLFVELLDECLAGSLKVVVFSQYTSMLDIIEDYLDGKKISYAGLRGSMTVARRSEMIEKFQNNPDCRVFCASLLAGGVGIDLTAAQAVIHYDRWWNAAKEDQATSRVHRLGQKQVVQVFKLVTIGTLEEKIHRMITAKRELAGELLSNDDGAVVKRLRREDLRELLRWAG